MNFARLFVTGFSLLSASPAHAGAWPQPAGNAEAIVTVNALEGRGNPSGSELDLRHTSATAFLEYGIDDATTLVTKGAWDQFEQGEARFETLEGRLGVRRRIARTSGGVMSLQLTAEAARIRSTRSPQQVTIFPASGVELRLLAGQNISIGSFRAFASLEGGLRLPVAGGPRLFRMDVTAGLHPRAGMLVLAQFFREAEMRSAGARRSGKLQVGVVQDLGRSWAVQLGYLANVDRRGVPHERGVVMALWRRF